MSELGAEGAGSLRSEDLEDLYENAPCGYLSLSADGRIVKVNATFCSWLGFTRDHLLGTRLADLLNIAGRIFYETHFAPLLRMQGFFNEVALDFEAADGRRLAVLANAAERRDESANLLFTRLTIFPATDRRRYERDLVNRAESAQRGLTAEREMAELREQFIAILGHDLRNPIASIDAGARMLARAQLSERDAQVLQLMRASISRVNGMIDNLMDLARGRFSGGIPLDRVDDKPLEPTLALVVDELRAAWPDRAIESRFDIAAAFSVDHGRLSQLLSNLLGNAITHGAPDAPIRVRAELLGDLFELSVSNSGDPIPAAALEHLFQPFYRGRVEKSQQGLGLGLYIASEIAKAHGGTLEVSSTPAETRFTFRMPCVRRPQGSN